MVNYISIYDSIVCVYKSYIYTHASSASRPPDERFDLWRIIIIIIAAEANKRLLEWMKFIIVSFVRLSDFPL